MLVPEEAVLVVLVVLVLVSIACVVILVVLVLVAIAAVLFEVEVEVELLLLALFPSIWKMVESCGSENLFRGEVKLAPPLPLFPNCQDQESNHAR